MSEWEQWYTFEQPESQPPAWEEGDVLSNQLPWDPSSDWAPDHLKFKLYSIQQELLRTREELEFLPQDALNTLAFLQQQQALVYAASAQHEAALQRPTSAWQALQHKGSLYILGSWKQHVGGLQLAAWRAFAKAGLVLPVS